ncbi:MAG: hypothetical protein LBQ87_00550 [Candidatus Fibromonas sp.]|nr:hypothetical protein [Candidatus Fibromonas sp.]
MSKFAKLSLAALLASASIATADDVPVVNVGGTKISLYGFLQANAVYENNGSNSGLFWTEKVPSRAQDGESSFAFNVNQTRIGFNLSGPQTEGGGAEVSGKFESDFANDNNRNNNGVGSFRIRQSFGAVKFKDLGLTLLIGQTNDLIGSMTAPTLNQAALKHSGSIGTRRPQIRLTEALGPAEIAVAVTDDRPRTANSVMPAFQGSAKVKVPAAWAGEKQNLELVLSGHYGTEEPALPGKEPDAGKPKYPSSYSGVASLALPVVSVIGLSGEFFLGQNLDRYSNGSIGLSGTSTKGTTDGKLDKGIQSLGGWGAVTVKLPANLQLVGGLGIESIDKDGEKKSTSTTSGTTTTITLNPNKNMTIFGNLRYNVSPSAFIGLEYAYMKTDYASFADDTKVDSGKLNRVELAFNYAFK